jgi:5-methylcytosine-specific restriction enzyme A
MNFDPGLHQGTIIDNRKLCELFKCSPQGGMRRSLFTNSLVIVSNHVNSIYDDRWIGEEFHYTGMGMEGDQSLLSSQNKTLAESQKNHVDIHLFEVFEDKKYTYIGRVFLSEKPYQEKQLDQKGRNRTVWMFPLRLKDHSNLLIPDTIIQDAFELKERKAKSLSDSQLKLRANSAMSKAGNRQVISKQYDRNPWISEYAKRRATGICQLCDQAAPFKDKAEYPFLETHHIVWLSMGGEDSITNTVALCPNCHRKMHILNKQTDIQKLMSKALKGID